MGIKDKLKNTSNIESKKQDFNTGKTLFDLTDDAVTREMNTELFKTLREDDKNKKIVEMLEKDNKKVVHLIHTKDLAQAPTKMNIFKPLKDNKLIELCESIYTNGLLFPIIVWKINDKIRAEIKEYCNDEVEIEKDIMILAGHNRKAAYELLAEKIDDVNYSKILAFVYESDELSIVDALSIIVDSNYVQREMTVEEKRESIIIKYNKYKKEKGNTAKMVALDLGLKERTVKYYRSLDKLEDRLLSRFNCRQFSIVPASMLAQFSPSMQAWLNDNYGNDLCDGIIRKLKKQMSKEQIENIFKLHSPSEYIRVSFEVPEYLEKEFRKYAREWLSRNKKGENAG